MSLSPPSWNLSPTTNLWWGVGQSTEKLKPRAATGGRCRVGWKCLARHFYPSRVAWTDINYSYDTNNGTHSFTHFLTPFSCSAAPITRVASQTVSFIHQYTISSGW